MRAVIIPSFCAVDKARLSSLRFVTGCKRHVQWTKALHTNFNLAIFSQAAAARCGHVLESVFTLLFLSHSSTCCCFPLVNAKCLCACGDEAQHLIGCCDPPGQLVLKQWSWRLYRICDLLLSWIKSKSQRGIYV